MDKFKQVSVVGGDSLIGKELREQLEERKYPVFVKELGSAEDEFTSILTVKDGEAAIQPKLDATALMESEVVFLTGTAESSEEAWDILSRLKTRPEIVDVTGFLPESTENVKTVVHPAASSLVTLLSRIVRHQRVREAVVNVFQPASELGRNALEELQQQTRSLLNLQSQNKEVFDAQLAFTMLPRYGSESAHSLKSAEDRIYRDVAASGVHPVPSIRLIQAPVFHGYTFSIWLQFEENPGAQRLREILASAQVDVRDDSTEPPTNTGVVGQPGVTVGLIEVDRNDPKACWLWAAADNFRVLVDDAIDCVRPLLVGEPE